MMTLADQLADQLGHVRIQQEQLGTLAHHLLSAIDIAHTLELGRTDDPFNVFTAPPAVEVAVDTETVHEGTQEDIVPPASRSKYDLAQVATIAREAIELGVSPRKHVHDQLAACPSSDMAATLIAQARRAGHVIPKLRTTQRRTPAPPTSGEAQVPGKHFHCSVAACGHSTSNVREMNRHTRSSHNRDPYVHERIPA